MSGDVPDMIMGLCQKPSELFSSLTSQHLYLIMRLQPLFHRQIIHKSLQRRIQ